MVALSEKATACPAEFLASDAMPKPLLPKLKDIVLLPPFCEREDFKLASSVLTPALRSLNVKFHQTRTSAHLMPHVRNLLYSVASKCPDLTDLGVNDDCSRHEQARIFPNLQDISMFRRLRSVAIDIELSQELLEQLSILPNLRKLWLCPVQGLNSHADSLKAWKVGGFESLELLSLDVNDFADCVDLIRVFTGPLKLKVVILEYWENSPVTPLFDALRDLCVPASLKRLVIKATTYEDPAQMPYPPIHHPKMKQLLTIADLRKLFCYNNLKVLHLYDRGPREYATKLNDKEFLELGQAWPTMEDLRLPTNDDIPPTITHEGLRQFVPSHPRLLILHISVDASALVQGAPIQAFDSLSKCLLCELLLDYTSNIPDTSAFALLLAGIVPNLCKIRFHVHAELLDDRYQPAIREELERLVKYYQLLDPLSLVPEHTVCYNFNLLSKYRDRDA
jgi:hypothetical protein